jgi:hypothetical protein
MAASLPAKGDEAIEKANSIATQCAENAERWKMDTNVLQKYVARVSAAKSAYAANADPNKRNHVTAVVKRETLLVLREYMPVLVAHLLGNEKISNEELESMGLPSRRTHHHVSIDVPSEAPELVVFTGRHHSVDAYVSIPRLGQPTERLKKKGYYGIVLRYRVEGEETWHEESSTRLHVTMPFDFEQQGKVITLLAAWINPRLQHGPWSDEIKVIIN